jgi:histidinol-phosphate phosphatase family protein
VALARPRIALLDRDGTLIKHIPYLHDPLQVELLPQVTEGLKQLRQQGYSLIMVSNQSGVGRGYFSSQAADAVNLEVNRQLQDSGCWLDHMFYCPHHPSVSCLCRKPQRGMVDWALNALSVPSEVDLSHCIVIGDSACDIQLAQTIGCSSYQLPHLTGTWDEVITSFPLYRCTDWSDLLSKFS